MKGNTKSLIKLIWYDYRPVEPLAAMVENAGAEVANGRSTAGDPPATVPGGQWLP